MLSTLSRLKRSLSSNIEQQRAASTPNALHRWMQHPSDTMPFYATVQRLTSLFAKSRGQQADHGRRAAHLRMASPRFLEDERPLALVALNPPSPLAAPLPTARPPTGKPPRLWADL